MQPEFYSQRARLPCCSGVDTRCDIRSSAGIRGYKANEDGYVVNQIVCLLTSL
jgi:hypothetical protein